MTSPGSVRCDVAKVRYVPSGLQASDPPFVLARKLTARPWPAVNDGTAATAATFTFPNVFRPAVKYAIRRESGDQAKSRASGNGGVSNTPVATSLSSFDTG